jgi:site-specific DNA recombinase
MTDSETLRAGLYARVSSEQQAKENTVASQVEALRQRITEDGLNSEEELCFVDDGYSGGTLVRPALEQLRDLAAAGGLDRLYVHSPDRLARKYAYQVLLVDELRRCGVELVFLNRQIGTSPEEDLLLQVQGMVAEYERAKILERSRRGKRHAARRGRVNVLGGAPYGYRYVGKHDGAGEAGCQIVFEEARVVKQIFEWVTVDRLSIGEVCRRLKREQIASPRGKNYWDRTTVWGILKNPAYKGSAAFGKTRVGQMRPRLRPQRGQSEQPRRAHSIYSVPSEDWIRIPVPAIVSEEIFDAVAEQLAENRARNRQGKRGARYLLQGLLTCRRCGYAFYGKPLSLSSGKGKRRDYAYYRCIGMDAYRFGGQRICHNKQVRTDLLESAVWQDVCSLLNEPERIEREYQRRLANKKKSGRSQMANGLADSIKRVKRGIARLIDAYEDGLVERAEFEPRIKRAKDRLAKLESEAKAEAEKETKERELRLVIGRLQEFGERVRGGLDQADWMTRREIIRALVKHVEIDEDSVRVVYRVSSPAPTDGPGGEFMQHCRRREWTALRRPFVSRDAHAFVHHVRLKKAADDSKQAFVGDTSGQTGHQDVVVHSIEELLQIEVHDDDSPIGYVSAGRSQRIVRAASRSETVARCREGRGHKRFQHLKDGLLDQTVDHRRDAQLSHPATGLGDVHFSHRLRSIPSAQ